MQMWVLTSIGTGVAIGLISVIAGPFGFILGIIAGAALGATSRGIPRRRTIGLMVTAAGATAALLLGRVLLSAANDPSIVPSPTTAPVFVAATALVVLGLVGVLSPSVRRPPGSGG